MKTHIKYFDVLRVIAILAVITLHVAAAHSTDTDVFSFTWEMSNMWDGLTRWGVPVFVMISGALFLDPTREFSFHKLYSKNIFHITSVLLFWSVGYALLGFVMGSSQGNIEKLIANTVLGHFHLWFLYMLLGLYIIVPLLRPICKDIQLTRYFLIISLIFSFLIPTVTKVFTGLDLIMPNSFFSMGLKAINSLFNGHIHFHFTLEYVAYFVLGYYIHQTALLPYQRKIIYLLGILGWTFSISFAQFVAHTSHINFDFYSGGNVTLYVLFESLAVFVFVKYHINILSEKVLTFFNYLSKRVLGIYLIHAGIQSCLSKFFGLSSWSFNPLISIPSIALLIFCLSWISTEIIKRIPWLGKKII